MVEERDYEIKKKLVECGKIFYADGPKFKSGNFVPENAEADVMIRKDPFAFLIALTCD